MSFTSYLVNMGIDVILGIVGLFGLMIAVSAFIQGHTAVAFVFLVIGGLPLLYTRYRTQKKGITY